MAYTTKAEIEADFKEISFSTDTLVKEADVTQFIVEADSLINSYVGTVYTVPVAAGEGLNLLKLLSRSLVASRIKRIMEVVQDKSTDANQSVVGVLLSVAQVIKILENIQNKKVTLAGASALTSTGGFYSKNASDDVEPVIKKDCKQW